jgi:hypothetical protein
LNPPNRHIKSQLKQALIIRGSHDFNDHDEYECFVHPVVARRNRRVFKVTEIDNRGRVKLSIKEAQIEEGTVPEPRVAAPEAAGDKAEEAAPDA